MFVALGLSAIFPIVHGLAIYGHEQLKQSVGLYWAVLQGFLYILGAAIYAVRNNPTSQSPFIARLIPRDTGSCTGKTSTREI